MAHMELGQKPGRVDAVAGAGGFQEIVGMAVSTPLTVPTGATAALIHCEVQAVRLRADGTAPTATTGVRLAPNDTMWIFGALQDLRFIQEAATAELNVQYFQ